jgi:hypothetical protein
MSMALAVDVEPTTIQPVQDEIGCAVARWRQAAHGEGNAGFYQLAIELKKMGMSDPEIKTLLIGEAKFGRSPAKRTSQIPSIMASLASWKMPRLCDLPTAR